MRMLISYLVGAPRIPRIWGPGIARILALPMIALALNPLSPAQNAPAKRPMTFEDMMAMKRLGETAVSPDGKWLAYSVTTVDLAKNTKTPELWLQAIAGGEPMKLAGTEPGDSNPQFSADGKRILFISGREGGQQVWVEDFDTATGAASNLKKLTSIATEADSPKWSPDGRFVVFLSSVYPDCTAIRPADGGVGDKCNAQRDAALADSKVKAQIWTHLLYRHWDHYTGEKRSHVFLLSVDGGGMRDLNPNDPRDVPPFSLDDSSCGCNFSPDSKELAFTENLDPEPATSISASIFTLDLTDPAAKQVKVSTSAGGNFNPAYSPNGKYLAWRSEERAGYESDKFRLVVYERAGKAITDVMPRLDYWVDEFAWGSNSKSIYFTGGRENSPISITGIDGHPAFVVMDGTFSDLHPLPDGYRVIASRMTVASPSEVVAASMASDLPLNKRVSPVTHLNDALLAQLDLPKMEGFWFNGL